MKKETVKRGGVRVIMRDKDKLAIAKMLSFGSVVAVILALVGSLGSDLWLASTQWMLVALVLGIWAVFVVVESGYKIGKK
jgi:hypothetical protein